jgi:hypothetical protein
MISALIIQRPADRTAAYLEQVIDRPRLAFQELELALHNLMEAASDLLPARLGTCFIPEDTDHGQAVCLCSDGEREEQPMGTKDGNDLWRGIPKEVAVSARPPGLQKGLDTVGFSGNFRDQPDCDVRMHGGIC